MSASPSRATTPELELKKEATRTDTPLSVESVAAGSPTPFKHEFQGHLHGAAVKYGSRGSYSSGLCNAK